MMMLKVLGVVLVAALVTGASLNNAQDSSYSQDHTSFSEAISDGAGNVAEAVGSATEEGTKAFASAIGHGPKLLADYFRDAAKMTEHFFGGFFRPL